MSFHPNLIASRSLGRLGSDLRGERLTVRAKRPRCWGAADIGDQTGRVAIVTGSNTGIGYAAAAVLADRGAHVVLAVRSAQRGNAARQRIIAASPHADVAVQEVDLSSLDSVRAAADAIRAAYPEIDLLINNAGVVASPRQLTQDGFERHFGTNHLGHFALTGLILDHLLRVHDSRVVNVSSQAHRGRIIDFDDLGYEHDYKRFDAYGRSKLANLLFTRELQRRLAASYAETNATSSQQHSTIAVAAHPGIARTDADRDLPASLVLIGPLLRPLARSALMGAMPTLRAATDPTVLGGQYYGPEFFRPHSDCVKLAWSSPQSRDQDLQERLWRVSEELTGVQFPV